ncbi:hypothetical protein BH11PAT2_BH11PAT2_10410 [soil metagenome]
MDEITILDKTYISSKRAAEITGYAKDYVGQLCREGHVDAKMVGRSWYVFEPSILKHRFGEERVGDMNTEAISDATPELSQETAPAEPSEPITPSWKPSSVYKAEPVAMIPELQTPELPAHTAPEQNPVVNTSHTTYTQSNYMAPAPQRIVEMPSEETHATLTDMQSAWREWFDKKQEPRIESPEVIDTRNDVFAAEDNEVAQEPELLLPEGYESDEQEFSIPIHKMQTERERNISLDHDVADEETEESDYVVPIQRIQSQVAAVGAPVYRAPEPTAAPEGVIRNERIIKRKPARSKVGKTNARSSAPLIALLVAVSMISLAIAAIGTGYAERYLSGQVVNNPVVNFFVGNSSFKR